MKTVMGETSFSQLLEDSYSGGQLATEGLKKVETRVVETRQNLLAIIPKIGGGDCSVQI